MKKQDESKTPKQQINIKKLVRTFMRTLAFIALFLLAAYGLRHMFSVMQETISYVLTVGIVLVLGYIIFE